MAFSLLVEFTGVVVRAISAAKDSSEVRPKSMPRHATQEQIVNKTISSLDNWICAGQVSHHTQRMGGFNAVALSSDETTVLTVGQEKHVTFWDLRENQPVATKVRSAKEST